MTTAKSEHTANKKRVRELLAQAKKHDAKADSLVIHAAGLHGDETKARRNSYLIESRSSRSAARAARRLAEDVATGHVQSTRRKAKRT